MTTPQHWNLGGTESFSASAAAPGAQTRPAIAFPNSDAVDSPVDEAGVRAVFYGRANAAPTPVACFRIARQFRVCQHFCADRAVITRFFYDFNQPIDQSDAQRVRDCAGPPEHHGGWMELTDFLTSQRRDADLLVCHSPDRISRRSAQLRERGALLDRYRLSLFCSDSGWGEDMTPWIAGQHPLIPWPDAQHRDGEGDQGSIPPWRGQPWLTLTRTARRTPEPSHRTTPRT